MHIQFAGMKSNLYDCKVNKNWLQMKWIYSFVIYYWLVWYGMVLYVNCLRTSNIQSWSSYHYYRTLFLLSTQLPWSFLFIYLYIYYGRLRTAPVLNLNESMNNNHTSSKLRNPSEFIRSNNSNKLFIFPHFKENGNSSWCGEGLELQCKVLEGVATQ